MSKNISAITKGIAIDTFKSEQNFLLYTTPDGKVKVEIFLKDENIWLTQEKIAGLFGVERSVVTKHLKNIYEAGELDEGATSAKFTQVQTEGSRQVTRSLVFYNLDAIISVGYRVNSVKATQCSADYSPDEEITKQFFATVQNKLHWAVTHQTAAEIIHTRVDSGKPNMGLTNWKNSPKGKIRKTDVGIAKNYLNEKELDRLNRIVTMYLDYAELQASRGQIMYMKDWVKRLDAFLQFNEQEILQDIGRISHEVAVALAEEEFEKYNVKQDRLLISDFDKVVKKLLKSENK